MEHRSREAYELLIDDHLLTFMCPKAGGSEPGDVVVMYEDAHGETSITVDHMTDVIKQHESFMSCGKEYEKIVEQLHEIKSKLGIS